MNIEPKPESEDDSAEVPEYTLEELLKGMTPEQFHPEIDTGPPIGNEIW